MKTNNGEENNEQPEKANGEEEENGGTIEGMKIHEGDHEKEPILQQSDEGFLDRKNRSKQYLVDLLTKRKKKSRKPKIKSKQTK